MAFDPKQCRVLLVGKLMARLEPFLKSKGYVRVEAEESGQKAVSLLASASYHLVLLEVNLRDIELRDFFLGARAQQADASFILLAPPTDAENVVSALVLGADAYVPLPPDEQELFQVLERHGAAAVTRKSANPDAQPGVSEKVAKLEQELEKARAQVADLEEQNALFEAETARLQKLLEAAKSEAAARPAAEPVPPGHQVVAIAKLEELESKATFAEFLESENDEVKRERDALLEKLRALGLDEDAGGDEFDEPTGAVHIDDEVLARGLPKAVAVEPNAVRAADAAESGDGDGEDDGDDLLIMDDDDDDDEDGDEPAVVATPPPVVVAPPAPAVNGKEAAPLDDQDERLAVEDLLDDESEEFDLAALEALMAKSVPAAAAAVPAGAKPAPAPAPKAIPAAAPAPKATPAAAPAPPPTADADDDDDEYDDFEDVNTDALLRLAADVSGEGPTPDELEALLADIDDD